MQRLDEIFSTDDVASLSRFALVITNVLPIVGVLLWDWDVQGLLLLYWSENLIIGGLAIVKMIHHSPIGGLFSAAFFFVHYGAFCAVHGMFIILLTTSEGFDPFAVDSWPFVFVFQALLFQVVDYVFSNATFDWLIVFLALLVSHGTSFITNYVIRKEWKNSSGTKLMTAPYARIIVLHFTIIIGAFAVLASNSPVPLLIVLVVIKTIVDLIFHMREHRKSEAASAAVVGSVR